MFPWQFNRCLSLKLNLKGKAIEDLLVTPKFLDFSFSWWRKNNFGSSEVTSSDQLQITCESIQPHGSANLSGFDINNHIFINAYSREWSNYTTCVLVFRNQLYANASSKPLCNELGTWSISYWKSFLNQSMLFCSPLFLSGAIVGWDGWSVAEGSECSKQWKARSWVVSLPFPSSFLHGVCSSIGKPVFQRWIWRFIFTVLQGHC